MQGWESGIPAGCPLDTDLEAWRGHPPPPAAQGIAEGQEAQGGKS